MARFPETLSPAAAALMSVEGEEAVHGVDFLQEDVMRLHAGGSLCFDHWNLGLGTGREQAEVYT